MYDNRPPEQQAIADGVLGHDEFDDAAAFEGPGQGNLMLDVQRAPGTPKVSTLPGRMLLKST
jgi:hypothetical protein